MKNLSNFRGFRWKRRAKLFLALLHLKFLCGCKGLARKLGNNAAETLLRRQMFPSLAARETCCGDKFCCSETKSVFAWSQIHFCFPDTNVAIETYVS